MRWRAAIQTLFDQDIQAGNSASSTVLDYGDVLDNHFAQVSAATEVGTGETSLVMWGSLDKFSYYPLTSSGGTALSTTTPGGLYVTVLQATGIPARYVYVQATQSNNEVQQVTVVQTGA